MHTSPCREQQGLRRRRKDAERQRVGHHLWKLLGIAPAAACSRLGCAKASSRFASQVCLRNVLGLQQEHAEPQRECLCVERRSVMFCFLCDLQVLSAPRAFPTRGGTLSPSRGRSPAACGHRRGALGHAGSAEPALGLDVLLLLGVTARETWAILCPQSKFSRFYWFSFNICLFASF